MHLEYNFSESFVRCLGYLPVKDLPWYVSPGGHVISSDKNFPDPEIITRSGRSYAVFDEMKYPIDRLVLEAYGLSYLPRDEYVVHIDGDISNNDIDNLVWGPKAHTKYGEWCKKTWRDLSFSLSINPAYGGHCWRDAKFFLMPFFRRQNFLDVLEAIRTDKNTVWRTWIDRHDCKLSLFNIYTYNFDQCDDVDAASKIVEVPVNDIIRLLTIQLFPVLPNGWMITRGHVIDNISKDNWPWFTDDACKHLDMRIAIALMQITNKFRAIEYSYNGEITYYKSPVEVVTAHPEVQITAVRNALSAAARPRRELRNGVKQIAYFPMLTDALDDKNNVPYLREEISWPIP